MPKTPLVLPIRLIEEATSDGELGAAREPRDVEGIEFCGAINRLGRGCRTCSDLHRPSTFADLASPLPSSNTCISCIGPARLQSGSRGETKDVGCGVYLNADSKSLASSKISYYVVEQAISFMLSAGTLFGWLRKLNEENLRKGAEPEGCKLLA